MKRRSSSSGPNPGDCKIEVSFESVKEMEAFEAVLKGTQWCTTSRDGKLVTTDCYDVLVHRKPDPDLFTHWSNQPGSLVYTQFEKLGGKRTCGSAFYVQGIAGYGRLDTYDRNKVELEAAGFVCLRSRRGTDGSYWEIWYLPGTWAAKGPIKDAEGQKILRWLINLGVGQITYGGDSWGLGPD